MSSKISRENRAKYYRSNQSFLELVILIDDKYSAPEDQKYRGWDIVFHNTLPENVSSITKHGFRIPKQHGHVSRFRLNWGDGIYCSPFATYSWSYGHRWENTVDKVMLDPEIDAPNIHMRGCQRKTVSMSF